MRIEKTHKLSDKVAFVGLGYVGLPLLCLFSNKYRCCGLDIDNERILGLKNLVDSKHCVSEELLSNLNHVFLTSEWNDLKDYNYIIVAAPTPINSCKEPDITILRKICHSIGKILSRGKTVIFESTVAPGTTEEICIPILELESGLTLNKDFNVGYSPERINIGDTRHTISNTPKIVSASNNTALSSVVELYRSGLGCDVISASCIKVAEASKLYENVQRDVLIALANQYSEYCRAEGISINEVTKCASTKWNFAEVYPGLVGGHCIGIDPYYLMERAKEKGIELPLVESSRDINELAVRKVSNKIISLCSNINHPKILILGIAYKPDSIDVRNSKAIEIVKILKENNFSVYVYDPLVKPECLNIANLNCMVSNISGNDNYDIVIGLVNHKVFNGHAVTKRKNFIPISDLL